MKYPITVDLKILLNSDFNQKPTPLAGQGRSGYLPFFSPISCNIPIKSFAHKTVILLDAGNQPEHANWYQKI